MSVLEERMYKFKFIVYFKASVIKIIKVFYREIHALLCSIHKQRNTHAMIVSLWRFTHKTIGLALFIWFYWRLKLGMNPSHRDTPKFNLVAKCLKKSHEGKTKLKVIFQVETVNRLFHQTAY